MRAIGPDTFNAIVERATKAALRSIDSELDGTNKSKGPLGDELAFAIDALIREKMTAAAGLNYLPNKALAQEIIKGAAS